ncbi:hypothetical protein [Streptomyces microflavus]|uniref:hypothetical protein n=1 Tax=Streptomyces microflavus TaxID=1919 RepID=UPI002E33B73E|nr:hypothetical protein [Streptomyces microflavus]
MGEFRLAGAYVEARMDRTKLNADIAKLQREKVTLKARVELDTREADQRIVRLVRDRRVKVGVDLDERAVTASLQRLTRDRTMQVKIDLDDRALARLASRRVDISATLNEAALRRTERALDKLTADRTVRILATADTRVAADEIRNLTRRQRVRIGVDVDTRVAANDIANLTRRRMLRVTADADTAAAANSLRFLTRDRRINIRTSMLGLGNLGSLGSSLGSSASSAGMLGSRFMMLASAALLALPAVASLGQAIVQMGPAAALAVPALGSLITMGAALGVGLHGVGTAFKSAFETGASSATAAVSAARAVESAQINVARSARSLKEAQVDAARQIADAQKRVQDAVEDVRDAEVQAAADRRAALQRVADAERDLADAQADATRAQEDLNEARKTAADQLQDLANRLTSAELDQRDAVMDVADAEKALNTLKAKGSAANTEDLARTQLAYDKAVQRLKEQRLETQRLQEENSAAAKAGIEGSDGVKAAHERVADAQRNVGDKARSVGEAQANAAAVAKAGAESVRDAQEALAAAQQGVADAQVAASRQVRGAQEALADAHRAVAAAMAQGSTEATKFNDAMSQLSPNARSFVNAVKGIAPAWSAVRMDVQDALFKNFGSTLTRMSGAVLPAVRGGLVGMGGVLNRMGIGLMDTFTRLGDQGVLKRMFDGFTNGMKPLEKIPGQLGQAFVQLGVAAAPAFKRMTTAAGGAMSRISEQMTKAFESGHLEKVINQAFEIAKQVGSLLGDIFGTIGNIMKAASAGGGDALGAIGAVFEELRRITAMPEVQKMLTTIFTAVNAIAKLIATTLGAVIMAVLPLLAALAPTITALAEALGPVLARLAQALGEALMPIMTALLPIVDTVGAALIDVVTAVMPLLAPVGALIAAIVAAIAPVISVVLDTVVTMAGSLSSMLLPVIQSLIPVVTLIGQLFADLAPAFAQITLALLPLIPPLGVLAVSMSKLLVEVLTPLIPVIVKLAGVVAGMLAEAITTFVTVLTRVIGEIQKFVDAMTAGVEWVVEKFEMLYDKLVGHSIIPDLVKEIVRWFTDLWAKTKKIFTDLKDGVVKIWTSLWNDLRDKWNSFYAQLKSSIGSAWTSVKNSVSSLRTSVTNTWTNLWNSARDKVTSTFSSIRGKISDFRSSMTTAFSALRDGIGKIWSGIQSKLASPIRWVVGNVYNDGVRKMWNTIAGKINSKIVLPAIGLKFAKGGIVPGQGTGDTVPAMLTPNERVLSLNQVAQLGGHRAIDAMLGKDRSEGRTGGNPDNRVAQGMQKFDKGGIVGTLSSIGGAISGGIDWAKDLVIGGLKSAAQKAISSVVRPLINQMPGGSSPYGRLTKGVPNNLLDKMLGFLGNEDKKAVGGPSVQRGLAWARTQHGKAYQWGGNGNPSWDCSGLVSAIESVIRGESPHRRWATGAFSGNTAPGGWVRNLNSPYQIGITNAGVGHTAGTIAGVNVESRGGDGVVIGSGARGVNSAMWTDRYGYAPATKYDTGGLLQPGRTLVDNQTGKPEAVLTPAERAAFEDIVRNGAGITIGNINVNGTFDLSSPTSRKAAAEAMVSEMNEALRNWNRGRQR